jgi:hypothetical protein
MLFHTTITHSYQTCHAHDENKKAKMMAAIQNAHEVGLNVHGVYVDPPGHTFYMVLEADSMEQIVQFFDPMLELGHADIHPVMTMQAALDSISKGS